MKSEIPLARGLGISASAIVAAIEMVNQLCELQLSDDEKLGHAVRLDGHPDNVSQSLFGILLVIVLLNYKTSYYHIIILVIDVIYNINYINIMHVYMSNLI